MRRPPRALIVLMLASAVALALARSAHAAFVTPIKPPVCPSFASYPFTYGTAEMEDDWRCGIDPGVSSPTNPCPHYANNINHWRWIAPNPWTSQVDMHVTSFAVGLDGLDAVGTPYNTWVGTFSSPFWMQVGGTASAAGYIAFGTNDNGTAGGFAIDQIRICTSLSAPDPAIQPIVDNRPMIGVIQGPDDGTTFNFFLDTNEHAGIAMLAQGDNDFDLFAECGGIPGSNPRWVSDGTGPHDFIHVDQCQGQTIYVTIKGYSGSGAYTLIMAKHMANKDLHLKAATNFTASQGVKNSLRTVLTNTARRMYGASEGRIFITAWDFYPTPNCDVCPGGCDYCFKDICNACGTAGCYRGGAPHCEILGCSAPNGCTNGSVFVNAGLLNGFIDEAKTGYGASRRSAHELGHKVGGFPDEYVAGMSVNELYCPHTIMGNDLWRPSLTNYCVHNNHGKNGNFTNILPKSNQQLLFEKGMGPNWQTAAGNGTPDSYTYYDFDFGGKIGSVTEYAPGTGPTAKVPSSNAYGRASLAMALCLAGLATILARRKVS
jgi:hypothetical protein